MEQDSASKANYSPGGRRLFDVMQANSLVPHLERIFSRVRAHRAEMHELVDELRSLGVEPKLSEPDEMPPLSAEAGALFARLRQLYDDVVADLEELTEMGVEVKDVDGLVDLRSRYRGELVYLCWRYGEPKFSHWHTLSGGYSARQRIREPQEFVGTLLC